MNPPRFLILNKIPQQTGSLQAFPALCDLVAAYKDAIVWQP